MWKTNSYNYSDQTPQNLRDINFINSLDHEQFALYGMPTNYYKVSDVQPGYDDTFRDFLSSPKYEEPIQVRSFFKVDEKTSHGLTDIGADQVADRGGLVQFNITLIESNIGRSPYIGDVVEDMQLHQKFIIYNISKSTYKLGRPLRYDCEVKLYQDSK